MLSASALRRALASRSLVPLRHCEARVGVLRTPARRGWAHVDARELLSSATAPRGTARLPTRVRYEKTRCAHAAAASRGNARLPTRVR